MYWKCDVKFELNTTCTLVFVFVFYTYSPKSIRGPSITLNVVDPMIKFCESKSHVGTRKGHMHRRSGSVTISQTALDAVSCASNQSSPKPERGLLHHAATMCHGAKLYCAVERCCLISIWEFDNHDVTNYDIKSYNFYVFYSIFI